MRIIIDVTSLIPPLTGIGWYTANLLDGLIESSLVEDIVGIGAGRLYSRRAMYALLATGRHSGEQHAFLPRNGVAGARSALVAGLRRLPLLREARRLLRAQSLRYFARRYADYLYWQPNYILDPFGGAAVVTIHDLSHLRYPEYHPLARVTHLAKHLEATVSRATRINVVSEFTRGEVTELLSVASDRISVVPPGTPREFFPRSGEALERLLKRYGIRKGYVLSVGTLEPRKNLLGLLEAYLRLPAATRHRHPLVLVGARGWNSADAERLIGQAERRGEIIRLGYVPRQDMPGLYSGAAALAYLSIYEGFGMPLTEAMSCGTPVITSNRASMPEVVGDAGLRVDPSDQGAMMLGLEELLADDGLRLRLGSAGLQRAQRYTVERSLDALLASFSAALSSQPPVVEQPVAAAAYRSVASP